MANEWPEGQTQSMTAAPQFEPAAEDEYFALEERSLTKHEFWNGYIVAMAGAAPRHNRITNRVAYALTSRLLDTNCEVTTSDQKIKAEDQVFAYPDVVVSCEDEQFDPRRPHVLLNPHILVEILSPSTQNTDRGAKLAAYQTLPSLLDYLIVWPDMVQIEHYARQTETDWRFRRLLSRNQIIEFAAQELTIPVEEFYRRLDVPEGVLNLELPFESEEEE